MDFDICLLGREPPLPSCSDSSSPLCNQTSSGHFCISTSCSDLTASRPTSHWIQIDSSALICLAALGPGASPLPHPISEPVLSGFLGDTALSELSSHFSCPFSALCSYLPLMSALPVVVSFWLFSFSLTLPWGDLIPSHGFSTTSALSGFPPELQTHCLLATRTGRSMGS